MTDELTTEIDTEDGKRWLSTDGKEYKSRSGAWKRSKKLPTLFFHFPTLRSERLTP